MIHPLSSIAASLIDRGSAVRPATPPVRMIPGTWLVTMLLVSFAVLAVMMAATGLKIDPFAADDAPFYVCGLIAAALRLGYRHPRTRLQRALRDGAEYYALITLVTLIGAVASYPCAAATHGFVDARLQRMDVMLHFDWLAWYRTVAAHHSLQLLGRAAYQSIYVTPAIFLAYLAWTHRRAEARAFIATFWLAAIIALAMFHFMPAVGPLAYLWHGSVPYMPESALWQPELIPALRLHAIHYVDIGALRGLVSAPSFHTTAAMLYIFGAWRYPVLRWPVLAINVAMLLSTPVEGTHYLIDMVIGAFVALAAMALAAEVNLLLWRHRPAAAVNGAVLDRQSGGVASGASGL